MTFQPADSLSFWFFVVNALAMLFIVFKALKKAQASFKIWFGLLIYLFAFSAIVILGIARTYVIPVVPLLFASVILVAGFIASSEVGKRMSQNFSLMALVGFQGFRLPLELILHQWAQTGTVPETMTWTGQNWDIIAGISALIAAPLVTKNIKVAWAFQIVGSLLLLNVVRVVILSSPFPFAWPLENPLQLIIYFPYALIGPLFVGPALAGHLILQRRLTNRRL